MLNSRPATAPNHFAAAFLRQNPLVFCGAVFFISRENLQPGDRPAILHTRTLKIAWADRTWYRLFVNAAAQTGAGTSFGANGDSHYMSSTASTYFLRLNNSETFVELVGAKPLHLLTQTVPSLKSPTGAFIASQTLIFRRKQIIRTHLLSETSSDYFCLVRVNCWKNGYGWTRNIYYESI